MVDKPFFKIMPTSCQRAKSCKINLTPGWVGFPSPPQDGCPKIYIAAAFASLNLLPSRLGLASLCLVNFACESFRPKARWLAGTALDVGSPRVETFG